MPHFQLREKLFVQAIQLTTPLKVEVNYGKKFEGVIGDWLVMSGDGNIVTIMTDMKFWSTFTEIEESSSEGFKLADCPF